MLKEIADVIDSYNENGRYADYWFVDGICSLYVNKNGLNKYLKAVFTSGLTLKKRGSNYSPIFKTLSVGLDENPTPRYEELLEDQYVYFNNMKRSAMTLHELEHIEQERMYDDPEYTFEHKLVKLSNYYYMYPPFRDSRDLSPLDRLVGSFKGRQADRYYYRHHDRSPVERLANIKSLELTEKIMEKVSSRGFEEAHDEFVGFAFDRFNKYATDGYVLIGDRTNSPSYDFLKGIKEIKEDVHIDEFDEVGRNLPLREKVLYGLSLSRDEFDNIDSINPFTKVIKR